MEETKQSLSELWALLRNKEQQFGLNKLSLTERDILQAIIHIKGKSNVISLEEVLKKLSTSKSHFLQVSKETSD